MEQENAIAEPTVEKNVICNEYMNLIEVIDSQKQSDDKVAQQIRNTLVELENNLQEKKETYLSLCKVNKEMNLRIKNDLDLQANITKQITDVKEVISNFVINYNRLKNIPHEGIELRNKFNEDYENTGHIVYIYKEKRRQAMQKLSDEAEEIKESCEKYKERITCRQELYTRELEIKENELKKKRKEFEELKSKINDLCQMKEDKENYIRKILDEKDDIHLTLNNLSKEYNDMVEEFDMQKQIYANNILKLQEELQLMEERNRKILLDIQIQENAYLNQAQFIKEIERENEKLESYIEETKRKIEEQQNAKSTTENELKLNSENFQLQLEKLEKETLCMQEEINNLRQENIVTEQEISTNEESLKKLVSEVTGLEKLVEEKQEKSKELEKSKQEIIKSFEEKKAELNKILEGVHEKKNTYKETAAKISAELSEVAESLAAATENWVKLSDAKYVKETESNAEITILKTKKVELEKKYEKMQRDFEEVMKKDQKTFDEESEKCKAKLTKAKKDAEKQKRDKDNALHNVKEVHNKDITKLQEDLLAAGDELNKLKKERDVLGKESLNLSEQLKNAMKDMEAAESFKVPTPSVKSVASWPSMHNSSIDVHFGELLKKKNRPGLTTSTQIDPDSDMEKKDLDLFDRVRVMSPQCTTPLTRYPPPPPGMRRLL